MKIKVNGKNLSVSVLAIFSLSGVSLHAHQSHSVGQHQLSSAEVWLGISDQIKYFQSQTEARKISFAGSEKWLTKQEVNSLNLALHQEGLCGMWADVTDHADIDSSTVRAGFHPELFVKVPVQQELVNPMVGQVSAQNLEGNVRKLSQFFDRYYTSGTGSEAADWIAAEFRRMAGNRSDIQVGFYRHRFSQPSVIVEWKGSGPLANEVVVLGAHEDSISSGAAPGADDDASGVSTLLEVFRILTESQFRPERTLVFMTYAGEEAGLLGSQDIAADYKRNQKNVFGVIQFDMTMYPGSQKRFAFFQDQANPLHDFTKKLVDEYVKIPWTTTVCFGCSSDHASWRRNGYAAVFPFEAPFNESNKKIHTVNDTLEKLDFSHGVHFAKLGVAFAVEMSMGSGWLK